jgi:hypothetical protein
MGHCQGCLGSWTRYGADITAGAESQTTRSHLQAVKPKSKRAFTLVELLVVIANTHE